MRSVLSDLDTEVFIRNFSIIKMWHIRLSKARWKEPAQFAGGVRFSTWVDGDVFRPFLAGEGNSIQQQSEDLNDCRVEEGMRLTGIMWPFSYV